MFSNTGFYYASIEKYTALLGVLFSNIKFAKKEADGSISYHLLKLFYGQNFKSRKDVYDYINSQEEISQFLPILTFYLSQISYNSSINRGATQNIIMDNNKIYTPVPYNFIYQFDLIAKSNETGYSILESILPWFGPSFVIENNDLKGLDIKYDTALTLQAPSVSPDTEIPANKLFNFNSSFSINVAGNLYKEVVDMSNGKIIETIKFGLGDMDPSTFIDSITITNN